MTTSSVKFAFAPGISCCEIEGQLILLDQEADRYLALPSGEEISLKQLLLKAPLTAFDQMRLEGLAEQGLLIKSDDNCQPQLCRHALPSRAIPSAKGMDVAPLTQLRFACRVMIARRILRWRGLSASLRRFSKRKASLQHMNNAPAAAVEEAATLLRRITLFTTSHDQCLPVALGLAHHLLSHRVASELVLGVQLGPFQAHCWLQHSDSLIGDDLDLVRTFTPILVL